MDTNTTLLIMTNGRKKYLEQTLSRLGKLHGNFTRTLIHDDSKEKLGFTKAMISAWEQLKEDNNEWVFHLEEDFLILEDIYLNDLINVLNQNTYLKQMVLLRQPLGGRELQKGGIIASHPERYEDKTDGINNWTEHRVGFSCNPCLYRKSLIYEYPWPDKPHSEREYGQSLLKEPDAKFAYWGKSTDKPTVMHIGEDRTGFNY